MRWRRSAGIEASAGGKEAKWPKDYSLKDQIWAAVEGHQGTLERASKNRIKERARAAKDDDTRL